MNDPSPFVFPGVPDPGAWVERQMFERRIVLVTGRLGDEAASELGAALMTLDAIGDDPIQMQFDSVDGTTGAALALMDIVDLCGVPVYGLGLGQVAGPAVGVLAVCSRRTLAPHARIRLCEPRLEANGNAVQLGYLAQAHLDQWAAFCSRLSSASGQPADRIRQDAAAGRFFSAQDAVQYGVADEIATPDARMLRLPGRHMGFRAQ
jgi:ATP-dependent Clp protease protease subunit